MTLRGAGYVVARIVLIFVVEWVRLAPGTTSTGAIHESHRHHDPESRHA